MTLSVGTYISNSGERAWQRFSRTEIRPKSKQI